MNKERNFWLWIILITASLGLIYLFRKILLFVVLAAVVGFIGDPIVDQWEKIKWGNFKFPRWVGALITLIMMIAALTGIVLLFLPLVRSEIDMILSLDPFIIEKNLTEQFPAQMSWLEQMGYGHKTFAELLREVQAKLSFNYYAQYFENLLGWLFSIIGGFISVVFMSFFFLKDEELFYKILLSITPDEHVTKMKNIVIHTKKTLSRYFGGLIIQILLMIGMVGIGLSIAGVSNAWLIALFSGVFNVIPYLGPLISFGFAMVIGMSTGLTIGGQLADLFWGIIIVYSIAQALDAFIVQPLILGGSIRVHPLELFIVLMAAATVGGIPAMAVALPVYTILRIAAREWLIEFKWVKNLTKNM